MSFLSISATPLSYAPTVYSGPGIPSRRGNFALSDDKAFFGSLERFQNPPRVSFGNEATTATYYRSKAPIQSISSSTVVQTKR